VLYLVKAETTRVAGAVRAREAGADLGASDPSLAVEEPGGGSLSGLPCLTIEHDLEPAAGELDAVQRRGDGGGGVRSHQLDERPAGPVTARPARDPNLGAAVALRAASGLCHSERLRVNVRRMRATRKRTERWNLTIPQDIKDRLERLAKQMPGTRKPASLAAEILCIEVPLYEEDPNRFLRFVTATTKH